MINIILKTVKLWKILKTAELSAKLVFPEVFGVLDLNFCDFVPDPPPGFCLEPSGTSNSVSWVWVTKERLAPLFKLNLPAKNASSYFS